MQEFKKDLNWFSEFLSSTNVVFIIHEDTWQPINLYIDACNTGAGTLLDDESYHCEISRHIISVNHTICLLEELNAVVDLSIWAHKHSGILDHLLCDNAMAVSMFQAGYGKDQFIQACARQLWLLCATHDVTLAVGHISGDFLTASADAYVLSC